MRRLRLFEREPPAGLGSPDSIGGLIGYLVPVPSVVIEEPEPRAPARKPNFDRRTALADDLTTALVVSHAEAERHLAGGRAGRE